MPVFVGSVHVLVGGCNKLSLLLPYPRVEVGSVLLLLLLPRGEICQPEGNKGSRQEFGVSNLVIKERAKVL